MHRDRSLRGRGIRVAPTAGPRGPAPAPSSRGPRARCRSETQLLRPSSESPVSHLPSPASLHREADAGFLAAGVEEIEPPLPLEGEWVAQVRLLPIRPRLED